MHGSRRQDGQASRVALEWLVLGAVLVTFALYAGFELVTSRHATIELERARLEHQARLVEKMLRTRLESTSKALALLRADAASARTQPDGLARLDERMETMAESTAGIRSFLLVDRDGKAIASNRKELRGLDFRDGERYRIIRSHPDASTLYISPPFLTPLGKWALSLGRAILDGQGRFDGYVLAIIDPEYFNLLLDSTRYAPDMATAMIHGGGMVIYRVPDAQGAVGRDLSHHPDSFFARHVRSGAAQTSTTGILTSTGTEALAVLQDVRPADGTADGHLVAFFSRDTSALLAPWRKELRDRVTLAVVVSLASASGLLLLQRRRASIARVEAEREAERKAEEAARASLQAQLAQAQRLESIGRLAGGVAHDFNNLLTVILSFADEGLADVRAGRTPEAECLEEIKGAAQRAAALTRQLLAFARKQVIAPMTLDVNERIRGSEKLLRRVMGEDLHIEERLQPEVWPVRCDPGLLDQILLNLAVNSRDAMPDGGTLTLTTENVSMPAGGAFPDPEMRPGDYVRLAVQDTGTGMTLEVLEHLFEPFFTTKAPGRGTGLGLATVYGIVKQSGAFMGVRSAPGQGATFEIFFPRDGSEVTRAAAAAPRPSGGGETILVVEDDAAVRAAVAHALRAGGYRVLTASSAAEALALAAAETEAVDMVLTDVVMPGAGGPEVVELVLGECPRARVLYMSGHSDEVVSHRGVLDEGVALLPKPFTPDALRSRVREILDGAPEPAPT